MRKSSVSTPLRVRNDAATSRNSSTQRNQRSGRPSIASVISRRSSVQDVRKESRLPNDKQNYSKNVKNLVEFLTDNNYPHPYNFKVMSSPSVRDLTNMFEFLISSLGIEYPKEKKFEDEFPRIMTLLRYPYTIGKRQLQPKGLMHNWPTIGSALSWLCSINKYKTCIDNDPLVLPTDGVDEMAKSLELEMHTRAYEQFMLGVDDTSQVDQEFFDSLPKLMGLEALKEFDEQVVVLAEKQEELEREKENYNLHQQQVNAIKADFEKLNSYLDQVDVYKNKLDERFLTLTEEKEKLQNKLKVIQEEVKEKESIVASQKLTVQDMHALKAVLENTELQVKESEEALSKAQNELLAKTVELFKEKDELRVAIEEYHSVAQECNLIPVSASNSQGYNYSVHLPKPESDTGPSNVNDIMGRLKVILTQWKELSRETKNKEAKVAEDLQQLADAQASKIEEIGFVEAKIRRQQEEIDLIKQDYATEMQQFRDKIAQVEEEIVQLNRQDKGSYDIEALQKTNKSLFLELQQLEQQKMKRETEVKEFLLQFCEVVVTHKNAVEERVKLFQTRMMKWCAEREEEVFNFDFEEVRKRLRLEELEMEIDKIIQKRNALK